MLEIKLNKTENVTYTPEFLEFVKSEIPGIMTRYVKAAKIQTIETYINSIYPKPLGNKLYNGIEICLVAVCNLLIKCESDSYRMKIDPNILYPGTHVKLLDLCKTINYGVLGIKGYPIFTQVFKKIEDNIVNLYEKYEGLNDGFTIR